MTETAGQDDHGCCSLGALMSQHQSLVNTLNTFVTMRAIQMAGYLAALAFLYNKLEPTYEMLIRLWMGGFATIIFVLWENLSVQTWKLYREKLHNLEIHIRELNLLGPHSRYPNFWDGKPTWSISATWLIYGFFTVMFLAQVAAGLQISGYLQGQASHLHETNNRTHH